MAEKPEIDPVPSARHDIRTIERSLGFWPVQQDKVVIDAVFRGGQMVVAKTGAVIEVPDGTPVQLTMPAQTPLFSYGSGRQAAVRTSKLVAKGTMVYLGVNKKHLTSNGIAFFVWDGRMKPRVALGHDDPLKYVFQGLRATCLWLPLVLDEDLVLVERGNQAKLAPCHVRIPGLEASAGSLNAAATYVARTTLGNRKSTSINVFRNVIVPDGDGYRPLGDLRHRAIRGWKSRTG